MGRTASRTQTRQELANQALEQQYNQTSARVSELSGLIAEGRAYIADLHQKFAKAEKQLGDLTAEHMERSRQAEVLGRRVADPLAVLRGTPEEIIQTIENDKTHAGCDLAKVQAIVAESNGKKVALDGKTIFIAPEMMWFCYRKDRGEIVDYEILSTKRFDGAGYHNSRWGASFPGFKFPEETRLKELRRRCGLPEPSEKIEPLIVEPKRESKRVDGKELLSRIRAHGYGRVERLEDVDEPMRRDLQNRFRPAWVDLMKWREQNLMVEAVR